MRPEARAFMVPLGLILALAALDAVLFGLAIHVQTGAPVGLTALGGFLLLAAVVGLVSDRYRWILYAIVRPVLPVVAFGTAVWLLLDASWSEATLAGVIALLCWMAFHYTRTLPLGAFFVRPAALIIVTVGLVLSAYTASNRDVAATALSCVLLLVVGLLLIRYGRVVEGIPIVAGSLLAFIGCAWHATGWTSDAPTWARILLVLLALPPVRWLIARVDPTRADLRQVAKLRLFGGTEYGVDYPDQTSAVTATNRSDHEIRDLRVVLSSEADLYVVEVSPLLLPGDSASFECGKYPPPFLELVFSDWEGKTWVHRRSIIAWASVPRLLPEGADPDADPYLGAERYWRNGEAPAPVYSLKLVGHSASILGDWLTLRRGAHRYSITVAEYLRAKEYQSDTWPDQQFL